MVFNDSSLTFDKFAVISTVKLNVFQSFSVTTSFDTQAWQEFINTRIEYERTQPQTLITNSHTNAGVHTNTDNHNNYSTHAEHNNHTNHTNHSNSRVHTNQTSHLNQIPHTNTTTHSNINIEHFNSPAWHSNINIGHVQSHLNWPSHNNMNWWYHMNWVTHSNMHTDYNLHTNNIHPHLNNGGGHYNETPHSNSTGSHSNTTPHTNTTTGHSNSPHVNNLIHSDSNPHIDTGGHSNASGHNNSGFDHENYVPSTPAFYDLTTDKRIAGTTTIALYSYDKNADGSGSQTQISTDVRYDLLIRKIKNPDRTASVSSWKTLLNNSPQDANGGKTFDLNTVDPLGTGNTDPALTEGYYELKAVARNLPQNGVAFQSQEQVLSVQIKQNLSPDVSIANGNEFINFTFSKLGRTSPANIFQEYSADLYSDSYSQQQAKYNGIFVVVNMKDPDIDNWQKGKAYLKAPDGTTLAQADVMWSDSASDVGSPIAASNNASKKGYVFFSKDSLADGDKINNALIRIEISDYMDSNCTQPTGDVTVRETISDADTTLLHINIDSRATITNFTDRVTGANSWMDDAIASGKLTEAEAEELNKYFFGDEIVCKFVINPQGGVFDKYILTFNANTNNTQIKTDYIKVVKIEKGSTVIHHEDPPIYQSTNSNVLDFAIDNPGNNPVTVYCKYKFSKNSAELTMANLTSKVAVTPQKDGIDKETIEGSNIIRIRTGKIIYR